MTEKRLLELERMGGLYGYVELADACHEIRRLRNLTKAVMRFRWLHRQIAALERRHTGLRSNTPGGKGKAGSQ